MKDVNQKNKRKIKQVDGIKVNHPHSAANIWYAFITLLLVAVPVGILFIPLIILPVEGADPLTITGLDYARFLFKGLVAEADNPLNLFMARAEALGDTSKMVTKYIVDVQAGLWAFFVLLGVIALILCVVLFAKGYLKKAKGPKTVAALMFVAGLLFAVSYLVPFFTERIDTGKCDLQIWYGFAVPGGTLILLIVLGSIYSHNFFECILESDLEYHEEKNGNVVTHVTEVHNVTKVKYQQASTLPNNITSIGGHAYSQNQALIVANIPLGISSLGNGAFSNCLKLRVVSIPTSVKEIGANCFFNCAVLERVNYAGTKAEWRGIQRGSNWLAKTKVTQVICNDGAIVVNPYH